MKSSWYADDEGLGGASVCCFGGAGAPPLFTSFRRIFQ